MSKSIATELKQELLQKYSERQISKTECYQCGSSPKFTRSILWREYGFCSQWCQYYTESSIRMSYDRRETCLIR